MLVGRSRAKETVLLEGGWGLERERESHRFHFRNLFHYLWQVCDEESRGLVFYIGEVRGECVSVLDSLRCAENGFESHVRLLSKQSE